MFEERNLINHLIFVVKYIKINHNNYPVVAHTLWIETHVKKVNNNDKITEKK